MASYEDILNRMLGRVASGVAKGEGSFTYDAISPVALEVAQAYEEMERMKRVRAGSAEDASDEEVNLLAAEQGLIRKPAVPAEGAVLLTGAAGVEVAAGGVVATASGTVFTIDAATSIPVSGSVMANITALQAGFAGNVAESLIIQSSIPNVSVVNLEPTRGGEDIETNEALLARVVEKRTEPAGSGNPAQYKQLAKTVPGIDDARVIRAWAGGGTVKVILISAQKRTPGASAVAAANALIQEVATVGSVPTVVGISEVLISVSAKVTLEPGASETQVKALVQDAMTAYFKGLAFDTLIVRASRIGECILSADGVMDYTDLVVNGFGGNYQLQQDQVPVVGAINLTI